MAEVWVDPDIGRALDRLGRVVVRITGPGGADGLRATVDQALRTFYARWDAEAPEYDGGVLVKEPFAAVSTVAPSVVVAFSEADDLGLAFPRLREALIDDLPSGARVEVQASQRRRARGTPLQTRLLHMRIAVKAVPQREDGKGFPWREGSESAEFIDDVLSVWLTALESPTLFMQRGYQQVFVEPWQVREFLRGKRNDDWVGSLASVGGDELRAVDVSYRFAWVSLLSGESSPDPNQPFEWRRALDELEGALKKLEPVVHCAFVQRVDSVQAGGSIAYPANRPHLFRIPTRNPLNSEIERELEQNGIVDAEGVLYFSNAPQGLPDTWDRKPFGKLVRVTAPNPDEWLEERPSDDTLEDGRRDLAALLATPSRSS